MTVTMGTLSGTSGLSDAYVYGAVVNDQGQVLFNVGFTPSLWQNGTLIQVPLAYTEGLNDSGEVVGEVYTTLGAQAALWQGGTAAQVLPTLGGKPTQYSEQAVAINDNGEAVGNSITSDGLVEACLWQNGKATALGILPGGSAVLSAGSFNSTAIAINQSGQIAGTSLTTGNLYHAVLWQNGTMTDLGTFGQYDQSVATGINAKGAVIGYDLAPNADERAFIWQNGVMTDLGTLPGRNYDNPNAVNDSGIAVGESGYAGDATSNHPVMWENGQAIDLNTLLAPNSGWVISSALAITDSGEIYGIGSYNGQTTAYTMTVSGSAAVIGVSVQTALQSGLTTSVAVVDTAANVMGSLTALQTALWNGTLTSINFSDASPPVLTFTADQLTTDSSVIAVMQGNFTVSVPSSLDAAQAAGASIVASHLTSAVAVSDYGYAVGQQADSLEILAKAGKLGAITLTDGTLPPVVSLQSSSYFADGDVLSHIQGNYQVEIADDPYWLSFYLDRLEPLVVSGKVSDISFANTLSGVPVLSVTSDQLTADSAALDAINQMAILAITPSSASATIAGLAGQANVVGFSGTASQYTITPAGDGSSFTVSGPGAADKLSGITAVQFSDYTLFVASQTPFTPGGVSSAQVVDLYAAVLARVPDAGGLAFYEADAKNNPQVTITQFAQDFLRSSEYTGKTAHNYAQSSAGDAQFITDIYTNLLHRAPEAGAVAWYQANVIAPFLSGVATGTSTYTTAELQAHAAVLADFSQSGEFLGDVSVTAQHPASAQHWLVLI